MTTTAPLPRQPFRVTFDGETHVVIAVARYNDGSFDVIPANAPWPRPQGAPHADWTIYPVELETGVVTIEVIEEVAA